MPKENKPLSESGRQNLYEEMGALIEDCCPLLEKRAIILRMMQELMNISTAISYCWKFI